MYTNNKQSITEKIITSTVFLNRKHLGINLTKDVQDLYHENHKTLLREIYKDFKGIRHWVLGLEDSVLLKCRFSPNWYINSVQYQSKPKQTSFFKEVTC